MGQDREADKLREAQLEREAVEAARARSSPDEAEAAQHERRAQKAGYLRRKLEQRAQSERDSGKQ
ncbi:MAG: hypothetical protein ACR2LV_07515 [Solirubrobacteraceae bacterium]